jgi:hypothetical protein
MLLALTPLHAQTNPPFADGTLFIEMEDYNYNGGQFISDATDGMSGPYSGWAYQNFVGIPGIDFNVPNVARTDDQSGYRYTDYLNGVGVEGGEPGGSLHDYVRTASFSVTNDSTLGYVGTGGNWYNYTRVFSGGVYTPYLRISSGASVNVELDRVVSDTTQSNQTSVKVGFFLRGGTGGYFSNYVTVPMQDAFGSNVAVYISGTNTLRISPFNYANINYLALVSSPGTPTSPYPVTVAPQPGTVPPNSLIRVQIADAGSGIDTNAIQLSLNGTNVPATLTETNGTVIVSYDFGSSLSPLSIATVRLVAGDTNALPALRTNVWTFKAPVVYVPGTAFVEVEDYNYNGGQFISDASDGMAGPYAGWAYSQLTGVPETDFHIASHAGTSDESGYRTNDFANGVGVQGGEVGSPMSDRSRGSFSVVNDSGMGYNANGNWYNYTRVFSNAATYAVYLRQAAPNSMNIELDQVTSDATQSPQTKAKLGNFVQPSTGSFYNFTTVPLQDFFGGFVNLRLSGSNTLRLSAIGTFEIMNYLVFVPVAGANGAAPYVQSATPGAGQRAMEAHPPISIQIADAGSGISASGLQLFLNGSNITAYATLTQTNMGLNYNGITVSYDYGNALRPFSVNTLQLILADTNTPATTRTNTWSFTAPAVVQFPADTKFVESEDYNYNSGQFISDATDGMSGPYAGWAYYGFTGTPEVDFHIVSFAAGADASGYRNNDFASGVGIQGGEPGSQLNDLQRSTFSVTADSMIGFNNNGEWYNYTRVFPDAIYGVYCRLASGSGTIGLALDQVTSDSTVANQVSTRLGVFARPATTSFYDFATLPCTNSGGAPVFLHLSGTNTFRLTVVNQFETFNYLAFIPMTPPTLSLTRSGGNATLSWSNGPVWFKLQSRSDLVSGTWTNVVNGSNSPVTVPITGTNQFFRVVPLF